MNLTDRKKVLDLCVMTMKGFLSWKKYCNSMEKLIKQIHGLKKAQLDLFSVKEDVHKNILSTLELHFIEKEESLNLELKILLSILEEFDNYKEILQASCNEVLYSTEDEPDEHIFKLFSVLTGLSADLKMITLIKSLPLRQSILQDLDSFKSLVETDEVTYPLENHFEELMNQWKELIS